MCDIHSQLAIREGRFREAAELTAGNLGIALHAAGGGAALAAAAAALEGRGSKPGAVAQMRTTVARYRPAYLGLVDRRRLLLWLVMLGAMDEAFAFAHRTFDDFARFETIGCQWGMLWVTEMRDFRRDRRFAALTSRLNLTEYWHQHGGPDERVHGHARHNCGPGPTGPTPADRMQSLPNRRRQALLQGRTK